MKLSWRTEWPVWIVLAATFALAAWAWPAAPARLPVHWNLAGQPDRWGGRFEGLLVLPLLSCGLYGVFLLAPRIDPGRANYPSFAGPYLTLRLLAVLLLAAIEVCVALMARGLAVHLVTVLRLGVGLLFVCVGNLLGKIRPNWLIGIRTPWTLSSKLSWSRTHRAGGWVFIAIGLLVMASALVHERWFALGLVAAAALAIAGLVAYSYGVWRADPDKLPPAGTTPAAP